MSWSQLNAGATIPHEHATGCNSMQIPSSKQDTSWAPLGCSGETCSLSEEAKSRTATASRASCHETRTTGESLPHFHRCVSSGGALPSTAVYDEPPPPPTLQFIDNGQIHLSDRRIKKSLILVSCCSHVIRAFCPGVTVRRLGSPLWFADCSGEMCTSDKKYSQH